MKRDAKLGFLLQVQNPATNAAGAVVLESSTNLVNWTSLATNAGAFTNWLVVDTSATNQLQRFYRSRR